jgi:hypothetical protein
MNAIALLLSACAAPSAAAFATTADVISVSDDQALRGAVARATAGTIIELAPGSYRGGLSTRGPRGTPDRPVIIRSKDANHPARIVGGGSGLHFSSAAHLEIRDLVIERATGNGLNIDDGGNGEWSHHIILANLRVLDVGSSGNQDGIKLSGVDHFEVSRCAVERWGEAGSGIDMVGCANGTIAECTFRHRADTLPANGVQIKGGSSDVVVKLCRFEHSGSRALNLGGSTGAAYFRPPNAQAEASDLVVEDCTVIGSMAPVAFVGVDRAIVRRNVIYRPRRWVLRILQENTAPGMTPCRDGQFVDNVVAFRSDELAAAVNAGVGTAPETFTFQRNAWFCIDRPEQSRPSLPAPEIDGVYGADPQFRDAEAGDFRRP